MPAKLLSHVRLIATFWSVALQAPLHGILQATILEWVAIPFSRGSLGSARAMDKNYISYVSCIGGRFFTTSGCLWGSGRW